MSNYWAKRQAEIQNKLIKKSEKKIERQLAKYYGSTAKSVIREFENVYNKLLAQSAEGKEITPADLYKLDRYWQMQGQLRQQLRRLGEKQISLLTKEFEIAFFDIYYSLGIEGAEAFSTIDAVAAQQLINSIWVIDGKNFSQRIWDNTERLIETLNEQLILTIAAGKKTTDLKNALQERFGVSYSRADTLVRTELCHIQTEAAKKRYEDYGVQYFEVLVDPDERTCELCKELIGKRFPINGASPLPVHPNERCAIVPIIE